MAGSNKKIKTQPRHRALWRAVTFIVLFSFLAGTFIFGGLSLWFGSHSGQRNEIPPQPLSPLNQDYKKQEVERWRKAALENPRDPFVLRNLAQALEAEGKNREARTALEKARDLSPKDYLNYELLGRLDFEEKKFKQAASGFRKALALKPNDADLEFELATALEISGDEAGAKEVFRKIAQTYPNTQVAFFSRRSLLSMAFEEKDYDEAKKQALSLYQVDPSDSKVLMLLGDIAQEQDRHSEAILYYDRAGRTQPNDVELLRKSALARYELAVSEKGKGENEKVKDLLQNALKAADSANDKELKGKIQSALRGM